MNFKDIIVTTELPKKYFASTTLYQEGIKMFVAEDYSSGVVWPSMKKVAKGTAYGTAHIKPVAVNPKVFKQEWFNPDTYDKEKGEYTEKFTTYHFAIDPYDELNNYLDDYINVGEDAEEMGESSKSYGVKIFDIDEETYNKMKSFGKKSFVVYEVANEKENK